MVHNSNFDRTYFVILEATMTAKDAIKKGYNYFCLNCRTAYKNKPQETMEGQGCDYQIDMCRCGCDLFMKFEDHIRLSKKTRQKRRNDT